jgi:hypothetical protein
MMRVDFQAFDVSLSGLLEFTVLFIVPSQGKQRFAQILLSICVTSVQFQRRFKVHNGFGKGSAVGKKCTACNKSFDIARINCEGFVEALKGFNVSAFFEVLDSFSDRSDIDKNKLEFIKIADNSNKISRSIPYLKANLLA